MDFHRISASETTQRTQVICNNQFAFESAYFTYGLSPIAETVEIRRYDFVEPSQTTSNNSIDVNIVYPIKEIIY
jgi:hypothetical protein